MATYLCRTCGKEFAAWVAGGDQCAACKRGSTPAARREKAFECFRRRANMTLEDISGRSLGTSSILIIPGFMVIFAGVFLGLLYSSLVSLGACFIGLALVDKVMFRNAHPLDRRRWSRFWNGAVLGYWLPYLSVDVFLVNFLTDRGSQAQADLLSLAAFPLALVVGVAVGFINVLRTDTASKAEVLGHLEAWRLQQSGPVPTLQPTPPPFDTPTS